MSQQNGSAAQIADWQVASLHPGPSFGAQQSLPGSTMPSQASQELAAASAQIWSHCVSQQNGSAPQIAAWQPSSSHPGPSCGKQQLLSSGHSPQSSMQLPQSSGNSHVPSPHSAVHSPQSSSQERQVSPGEQAPSPHSIGKQGQSTSPPRQPSS